MILVAYEEMSGNRSKKKKKTSNKRNSELDPLISFNGMTWPVVTQESSSLHQQIGLILPFHYLHLCLF
ncbi:hypothetical protein P8452_20531 [Trifolium repens]|nr:hypothetical protein P8452_20531 [Trifolium repens]